MNSLHLPVDSIFAIGDIHGNFNSLVNTINKYELKNCCIIVCGDCGLGFYSINTTKKQLSILNKTAKDNNVYIVMLRGNHDDPSFFSNGYINTKNILAVPDYTVLNDCILLIGGAISIDRQYRQQKELTQFDAYKKNHPEVTLDEYRKENGGVYWTDEPPTFSYESLEEIKKLNINIQHVCTHTCPSFCTPLTKDGISSWMEMDDELEKDVDNERDTMDLIYNKLIQDNHKLQTWTYGHYHYHNSELHNGIKFIMLDGIVGWNANTDWIQIILG